MMASVILPYLNQYPHCRYVELFGGAASLLFTKEPVALEVYNDLHSGLVTFFRVLQNPEHFRAFCDRVQYVPYSREEYDDARKTWAEQQDPVERAARFWIVSRMSFSGDFGHSWTSNVTAATAGMASECSKWNFAKGILPAAHERFRRVLVEHADWQRVLCRYDTPETLFYADPPYVLGTRRGGERYQHEMPDVAHQELVNGLLQIKGHAVVSGYESPIYEQLTRAGWRKVAWDRLCRAVGRTHATGCLGLGAMKNHTRKEIIWCSPLKAPGGE